MEFMEFRDRMFDVMNETDCLPISDIMVMDKECCMKVFLSDGSYFIVRLEEGGKWFMISNPKAK